MSIDSSTQSSLWGVARGLVVETLTHPLEVIKIRQQDLAQAHKCTHIARTLYKEGGASIFYQGLTPKLIQTGIKQMLCWPMITHLPMFLQRFKLGEIQKQAATGFCIAMTDAIVFTPLERAKILSANGQRKKFSILGAYKEGWQGFTAYATKRCIGWIAFLGGEEYFSARLRQKTGKPLTLAQLAMVGAQVGVTVGVVLAPFDLANTLKQTQGLAFSALFSKSVMCKWGRGLPLSTLSLIIHNIASAIVLNKLRADARQGLKSDFA